MLTKMRLYEGPSGPEMRGTVDGQVLTWDALTEEWNPEAVPAGSSSFLPIQQMRWLDPTSLVAPPDGSIRAPRLTFLSAWAEFVGKTGAWLLTLPGTALVVDAGIPQLTTAPDVIVQGLSQTKTVLALDIANQASNGAFEFRDVQITVLTVNGNANPLRARDAILTNVSNAGGTYSGSLRFINCTIGSLTLENSDIRMTGGTVSTALRVATGVLEMVQVAAAAEVELQTSLTFKEVTFGALSTIRCNASQTITLDLFSWGSLLAAGVTFPDTRPVFNIVPYLPVMSQIAGATQVVGQGTQTVIDCGVAAPEAEALGRCQATFKPPHPTSDFFVIVAAEIDALRHVLITVKNTSLTGTNTLTNPVFTITYEPRKT